MSPHWKIGLSALFLLGDLARISMIGKPRRPLTNGDAVFGLAMTTILLAVLWWPR